MKMIRIVIAALLTVALSACGQQKATTSSTIDLKSICGNSTKAPQKYDHIVVIVDENRTWNDVGLGFSAGQMPFMNSMAQQCSYYSLWNETNPSQSSLTQYIGMTSGIDNLHTVNDCKPSASCSSQDNNIFRQIRQNGGTTRSYVEGASQPCSAAGNAAKHIPAFYYQGAYDDSTGHHSDQDFCKDEIRPLAEFNVDALPTYSYVTPDLCNDGHDCDDATVDSWNKAIIDKITTSTIYKKGTTAIFVMYDEDTPVPNLIIAPTAKTGVIDHIAGSHASVLKTWEEMLGLPVLQQGQLPTAPSLRSSAGI